MKIAALLLALIAANPSESSSGPVLLDFHADYCGPCQKMRPEIARLAKQGYPVQSIDVERDEDTAERYRVDRLPTFVLVDSEGRQLARTEGYQPASELASWYRDNVKKHESRRVAEPFTENDDKNDSSADGPPRPWEVVVRIRILDGRSIGFGSGTIIRSTDEETIILTCAHIFHVNGRRQQFKPREFPNKIVVDLFDGKLGGPGGQTVLPTGESFTGQAIDYDFSRDVGLIRIKPGRLLPSARVVPPSWRPRERMPLTTVGCSEGRPATAWSTEVTQTYLRGLKDNPNYEAIQCLHAPKQGRSGGGLFTLDGMVAGVCDFAYGDPSFPRGLYATPRSIHALLDRNSLQVCYAPAGRESTPDRALARNDAPRRSGDVIVRAQNAGAGDEELPLVRPISIPTPDIAGVPPLPDDDAVAANGRNGGRHTTRRPKGWSPAIADESEVVAAGSTRGGDEPEPDDFGRPEPGVAPPLPEPPPEVAEERPGTQAPARASNPYKGWHRIPSASR